MFWAKWSKMHTRAGAVGILDKNRWRTHMTMTPLLKKKL
jgi:hypothetical protein